ncbi:MAG: hypothetical protein H6721_18320 [Sandaracinus sp.]|nr:hypothetical protein [Sandaracinus sp.]
MSVPTTIVDLANACRASVLATVGVELDFEPETLPILDHYAKNHATLAVGDPLERAPKSRSDDASDELVGLVAPMCGAYFGEVMRHHFDGVFRWYAPDDEHAVWRLEAEPIFLFFNPVGVALEVMEQEDAAGWGAHLRVRPNDREAVRAALELLGDVRDSDYYSFTVRFEVLEQVLETLGRRAQERGERSYHESAEYDAFVARENAG